MKLIHTSDIHLDASFAAAGLPPAFGNRRRQAIRDVFHGILERAVAWPADAVLIAGDLFEQERVSRDTVAFLRREFERVRPVPVFIAPGNHDPYGPSSPYATEAWPANVFIFSRPEWSAHPLKHLPLTVHGFAFDGIEISNNPFDSLHPPSDGRIHVAVGHGSERGHQPPGKESYAAFDAAEAAAEGLHYLALGHFHAMTPIEGPFATRIYYSGSPEGFGFRETGDRHYLEIEIDENNPGNMQVRPVRSSKTLYASHLLDCGELNDAQQIIDAIRAMAGPPPPDRVLRVTLTGACPAELRAAFPAVADALARDIEYLDLVDETGPAEDFDLLSSENTSLGEFIRRMNKQIEDAPDDSLREMLNRAREVGLAAWRGRDVPVRGLPRDAR